MRPLSTFVLLALMLCITSDAWAQTFGAQTSALIGDVFSNGGFNNATIVFSGGPGLTFDSALVNDAVTLDFRGTGPHDRGRAETSVQLGFPSNIPPVLRGKSVLTGNLSNQPPLGGAVVNGADGITSAFASDKFRYIGDSPGDLTLTVTLEGSLSDSPNDPLTFILVQAAVFANTGQYHFNSDYFTLIGGEGGPGATPNVPGRSLRRSGAVGDVQ